MIEETEDDSELDDVEVAYIDISQTTDVLMCVICILKANNIPLMSCKHFKIYTKCFENSDMKSKKT